MIASTNDRSRRFGPILVPSGKGLKGSLLRIRRRACGLREIDGDRLCNGDKLSQVVAQLLRNAALAQCGDRRTLGFATAFELIEACKQLRDTKNGGRSAACFKARENKPSACSASE